MREDGGTGSSWNLASGWERFGKFRQERGAVECTRRIIQFREIMSNTQQTVGSPFSINLLSLMAVICCLDGKIDICVSQFYALVA